MDLRLMRQFVAVAEELHFGRAAQRLNMAQPPLSQSIRRLEASLQVTLFDRSKRSVELTEPGRVFLVEARRTLMQAELARKMAQRAAVKQPEVRISFIGPALYQLLPRLIARYRAAAPGVAMRLFELSSPAQIPGILSGDYDIGFVTADLPLTSECETLLVERASFLAAVPADWSLARRDTVSLAMLAEQPFILPPAKYTAQSDTLSIFKSAGVAPRTAQEATQTNTALSLVGAGLGCSLVMETAALTQPRNVKFLALEDDLAGIHWEMAMVWDPQHLSPLARDFVRFVGDEVRDHPDYLAPRRDA